MTLIGKLSEDQQTTLITVAGKAMMDPWFVPMATIPMAYVLAYLPHFIKVGIVIPLEADSYNNLTPRYTNWNDKPHKKWIVDLIKRLASSHENGLEAMIGFAPAVILCKINKVQDVAAVKALCLRFIFVRFLFNLAYALGQWKAISLLRTVVWGVGLQTTMQLYGQAIVG